MHRVENLVKVKVGQSDRMRSYDASVAEASNSLPRVNSSQGDIAMPICDVVDDGPRCETQPIYILWAIPCALRMPTRSPKVASVNRSANSERSIVSQSSLWLEVRKER